jgi:exonuclease III
MMTENILCWNVCGLSVGTHHDAVRELVRAEHISFVCLQETKMVVILEFELMQIFGPDFEYFYLPAIHTRGGILVVWHLSTLVISNTSTHHFSVSGKVHLTSSGPDWWLSSVYGPTRDADKLAFLEELHELR